MYELNVSDLVIAKTEVQLFCNIFKKSADGSAFSPELGEYIWNINETAVIIEIFQMPFSSKKLYKVLLNKGGVGWTWDHFVISVIKNF